MITYAAVDWLTLVSNKNSVGENWFRLFTDYKKLVLKEELRVKRWNNGLYAGESIGHLRWGYSDRLGYILIASGSLAEEYYQRFEPAKHKVTRLDLCMDIRMTEASYIADDQYHYLKDAGNLTRPQKRLYKGPHGGDTLYIGSRQSAQCGRIYDKGIEQATDEIGCYWRFEVEYKKPRSGQVVALLAELSPSERHEAIASLVWNWFTDRGIVGVEEPLNISPYSIETIKTVTTKDKKLTWIYNQVRPSVIDLCKAGWGKEALDALGFDTSLMVAVLADQI